MQPVWPFPVWNALVFTLVIIGALWEVVWKGIALWRAARNGHQIWFIFLLIVNSVGILPIIYIFFFSKKKA
ncbi:MAG: DUF5652 family protein [Chloroflexota bacterium]